jgi:GrpB-like predicted nucleotidyltransferase (UPF0157 family)
MNSEDYLRSHTVGGLTPLAGPIRIVDYDPEWPVRFEREAIAIRAALGERAQRIEHVGSTSVPGLAAKRVIDILVEVADSGREIEYVEPLERACYRLHIREPEWYQHRMFKGQDLNLHVFSSGCLEAGRMLEFRDWLRTNDSDRELYARVKRALAAGNWIYTQNYADAKTAVIEEIIARARVKV